MTRNVPVANFRTKLDAEMAAGLLDNAGIPYLIQSTEGMLHGPISPGATILVGEGQAEAARRILSDAGPGGPDDPGDEAA